MSKLKPFVDHPAFSRTIMLLIVINAVLIGLETYPTIYTPNEALFKLFDIALLSIFTIEIILKLLVEKGSFFKSGWNVFDFIIVSLSLVFMGSSFVSVLRILRVLRVLRTISAFPSLRRLVNALFLSLPAMISTLFLMMILFYIYGIVGTFYFGSASPEYFADLQSSLLTLFQVFTLEAWASEVFRPIFAIHGWSWLYFSSFIILSAFIVANIFFGELVNNAQRLSQETETDIISEELGDMQSEVIKLRNQNVQLHVKLDHITALLQKQSETNSATDREKARV